MRRVRPGQLVSKEEELTDRRPSNMEVFKLKRKSIHLMQMR